MEKFAYNAIIVNKGGDKLCKHMEMPKSCQFCIDRNFYHPRCIHNNNKYRCKECGTGFCTHGRYKHACTDCGTNTCNHGVLKYKCKKCKETQIIK